MRLSIKKSIKKSAPLERLFCLMTWVAGPGVAPGLKDYACSVISHYCECRTISFSHREISRLVSTDSLLNEGCLGIVLRQAQDVHRYSEICAPLLPTVGPILLAFRAALHYPAHFFFKRTLDYNIFCQA